MDKQEAKEIIELAAASHGLIGYLSGLDKSFELSDEFSIERYAKRLNDHYIPKLKEVVKVFSDKLAKDE